MQKPNEFLCQAKAGGKRAAFGTWEINENSWNTSVCVQSVERGRGRGPINESKLKAA